MGLTIFRIITVVVPIVVIVCKLIMLNGNCCNKFLYIYRTARYLCSSVRFTPETLVSGVFLLPGEIGICWGRLFTHLGKFLFEVIIAV